MDSFFIILELAVYLFILYIFFREGELGMLYLPVILFTDTIISEHLVSAMVYYTLVSCLFLFLIIRNIGFFTNNFFSILIIGYFLVLLSKSNDIEAIRPDLFNVSWLFICIPLIPEVYRKFKKEDILKHLTNCSAIILVIFIVNVGLSSLFSFNVHSMYGITSGILYGNLYATDFNILSIAVFILAMSAFRTRNVFHLAVFFISLGFIILSMRRSVMGITTIGIIITFFMLFSQSIKKFLAIGVFLMLAGVVVISKTDFVSSFMERYELRNLEERNIEEEKRFFEYELLYNDMFEHNRYSPWFGFELFNSPGNYGDGMFYDRSLHGDIPSIIHSSGFIGLALYLLMIIAAIRQAIRHCRSKKELAVILFCSLALFVFTLTGRYTQVGGMMLIYLLMQVSIAGTAIQVPKAHNSTSRFQELAGA